MLHSRNTFDTRQRRPRRLTATVAALALAGTGLVSSGLLAAAPASADSAAQPVEQAFGYTGQSQTFTVPAGVLRVYLAAVGGAGGDGDSLCHGVGGAAGKVTGYLDVHPGDQISFFVGGGGHLSGAGGKSDPYTTIGAGGDGGADGGVGSGNGGGGGGATSVRYLSSIIVAGGGGGGGGRGISLLQCGGDGGAGGNPPLRGFNGTESTAGCYGYAGGIEGGLVDITGGTGPGASGAGGGGGGGDGAKPGQGGGASHCTVAAGGGGGGGGGLSTAGPALQNVHYSTSGQHGSDGSLTITWGNVTTTSVPPATARGGDLPLHAIVSGGDGGGTVDFSYPVAAAMQVPIPGCTGIPLVAEGPGVYEATCDAATQLVGADTVYATYSGDYAYGMSVGSNTYTITQLPSTTTLRTQSGTVTPGGEAALAVTVSGIDGYGRLTLTDNGYALSGACGPLTGNGSSWTATCQDRIVAGVHSLVASYSGDRGYLSSSSAPVVVTAAGEPSITGTPPAGTVGKPYTFGYTLAGDPAPTVSVPGGGLPPGLNLTADGRLTGTPTAAGRFTFTAVAANSVDTVQITSTVTVNFAVPGAPTIGAATPGDGSATVAFTAPASDGGTPITSYTATATPTGGGAAVTATGTGSPITVTGLTDRTGYTLTVTATNAAGTGPASAPSDPVTPVAPLAISTTALPGGQVDSAYTATLAATGGGGDYAWSLADGTLPAGLTLSGDGTISGSPSAAGRATVTVRVTDPASGQTATAALTLVIAPLLPHPDLAVTLRHVGLFAPGGYGVYLVDVANSGTAATSGPTTVTVTLPGGLRPVLAVRAGWRCARHGQTETCTQARPIRAHQRSAFGVLVQVGARAGTTLTSTATVTPTDATPADNTTSDRVTVIGWHFPFGRH